MDQDAAAVPRVERAAASSAGSVEPLIRQTTGDDCPEDHPLSPNLPSGIRASVLSNILVAFDHENGWRDDTHNRDLDDEWLEDHCGVCGEERDHGEDCDYCCNPVPQQGELPSWADPSAQAVRIGSTLFYRPYAHLWPPTLTEHVWS
jgi:hypothetical protein